jgi:hypothetical protein
MENVYVSALELRPRSIHETSFSISETRAGGSFAFLASASSGIATGFSIFRRFSVRPVLCHDTGAAASRFPPSRGFEF